VQDSDKFVFGAFTTEPWKVHKDFFGTGEGFVFTFRDGNRPKVFRWTGESDQIQYADSSMIGVGGGPGGRFALQLYNDFLYGTSVKSEAYNNEQLSKKADFQPMMVELWGFED